MKPYYQRDILVWELADYALELQRGLATMAYHLCIKEGIGIFYGTSRVLPSLTCKTDTENSTLVEGKQMHVLADTVTARDTHTHLQTRAHTQPYLHQL